MSETSTVRDVRSDALDHSVASAADDWLDNPRDAEAYRRLVTAVEARRAHLRPHPEAGGNGEASASAGPSAGGRDPGEPRTKGDKTRTRVLDAAAKVFSRTGYTGTRLSDIAAEAEMHPGSLYYHFRTREELVDEVLRVGQERVDRFVRGRLASLPDDTTGLDRLRELMTAHLTTVLEFGEYTSAMIRIIGEVPEDVHRRRLHDQRRYGSFWRAQFKIAYDNDELRTDVDLSAMMMFVLGALNSSPDWHRPGQGLPAAALGSVLGTLFLTGLATGPAPAATRAPGTLRAGAAPPSAETSVPGVAVPGVAVPGAPVPGVAVPGAPVPGAPVPGAATERGGTRGEATRARILEAAAATLREYGYSGSQLSKVAEAAELRPGSLYYYFASRDDLLATLLSEAWDRAGQIVRHAVESLPASASHRDRVSAAMTAHLLSALGHGSSTSGLLRIVEQLPAEVRHRSLFDQHSFTAYWCQLLDRARNAGEIRSDIDVPSVANVLIGTTNWVVEWYRPGGRLDPTTLAAQLTRMVFHGLAARP
jgi:AcrR family transcriptional regulator